MKFDFLRIAPKKQQDPGTKKLSKTIARYKTKVAWGLDIGGHALKAVKITQSSGIVQIEDFDVIQYPAIQPDTDFLQSSRIKEAIQTFLTRHQIAKGDKVVASVPGQFVLSRFTTIPPVEKKQLREIVRYEAKQQIPFDFKDIVWDYQQLSEQTPGAEGIEIGLFAAKRTTLNHILANVSSLQSRVTTLQVSPLAISNFIFFDQQAVGPTIIINVETENTDLAIANGRRLWLRNIPRSTLDNDLAKEIQRSIEYYKSLAKEPVQFKTVVLMGNKFKDPANVKFIADTFTYEIKILKTLNNVKLSSALDTARFHDDILNLGIAMGLAIQGVGLGRTNLNLMPLEIIQALEIAKKKPYAVAALGCFALSILIQYSGLHFQMEQRQSSNDHYQRVLQNVKELEKNYRKMETIAQTSASELEQVSSLDSTRFFWMEVFDKLLSSMPDRVSISSIQTSWIDTDSIKQKNTPSQNSPGFFQAKKTAASGKSAAFNKTLLMGIKGESKEPSISYIEKDVLAPIQNLILFEQKVPAFKNVEIVPGSCRQIAGTDKDGGYICFEIRWFVKSQDEIQVETKSLLALPGTSSVKS
ncbi:MAG: pilus assembly protein PilM [Planctomycetota bacterium]